MVLYKMLNLITPDGRTKKMSTMKILSCKTKGLLLSPKINFLLKKTNNSRPVGVREIKKKYIKVLNEFCRSIRLTLSYSQIYKCESLHDLLYF